MNITQKFKNRRPKSVFRQKSPDQCSRFEIFSVTQWRHLWSGHRPWCCNSPIQSWASLQFFQTGAAVPFCLWNWLFLICEKTHGKKSGLQPFQTEAAVLFCLWNWLYFDLRKTHEKSYRACRVVTGGWAGWAIARPVFGRLKGAAGFPSCLWNWLHFDLRKTHYKSNRASSLSKRRPWSNNFLSFQFCHPNHFAAFGESGVNARCRSETKWRLKITSNYLVIKTELFGM